MIWLIAYMASALVMAGLDYLWLTNMVGPVYRPAIGPLMADNPNIGAAVAFYLLYVLGIQLLAVRPGLSADDWRVAAWNGAILGMIAYGTYDLTNMATLKVWSLKVTLIDMAWGTLLTAIAAAAGSAVAMKLSKYI